MKFPRISAWTLIVSILLFLFGASRLFTYLQATEFGALNLDVKGNSDQVVATRSGDLLKGDKVWGNFHSEFTNLGIVSMRFYNQDRDSKDTLIFRLKEKGQDQWYYEAKYETDQFLPHKLFSFGFPLIKNSDKKDYEFQLESLRGATGSGILIDNLPPLFVAKSSYTKAELMNNHKLLFYFIRNKFFNIFGDLDLTINIFIGFLPLLIFLVFILSAGASYQYLTIFAFVFILFDIFLFNGQYDQFFVSFLFLWALISYRFHFESRIATAFSFGFLILTSTMTLFGQNQIAENTAVWAYLFLSIAIFQNLYEIKNKKQMTMTLESITQDSVAGKTTNQVYHFLRDKPLSLKAFLGSFNKFEIQDNVWMNKIHILVINVFLFLGLYFSARQLLKVFHVYRKFLPFYPYDYLQKYLSTLILPELILAILTIYLILYSRKFIKKSKFVLLIILLVFNFISGRIISKAIDFENKSKIISISPEKTNEAWTDIVITGKNFRNIPFVGKLYIDEIEQGDYMIYWSDEKIVFRTTPQLTKSGFIQVVPMDRLPSNKVPFSYTFNNGQNN